MPWTRGRKAIPVEVSRIQDWVERSDLILNGPNGDDGMIRLFYDDKAGERQREKSHGRLLTILSVILGFLTLAITALGVLEANRQLHDHTLTWPIFHSQVEQQDAKNQFAY